MNIVDIAILVILGVSVVYGIYKGFVHALLSLACGLISIVVAFSFGPKLADIISGKATISSTLATYTDAITRVGDYDLATTPVDQLSDDVISRVLASVSLPEPLNGILKNNLQRRAFEGTGLTTVNDYVSNTVVRVAVNVISFIVCYALCHLILSMLVNLIAHVFKLPLLRQLDWLAGGVFGLLRGSLIVYVVFLLLPILSTVIPLDAFNRIMQESTLAPIFSSNGFFSSVISGKLF